jgi:hypothetical protein
MFFSLILELMMTLLKQTWQMLDLYMLVRRLSPSEEWLKRKEDQIKFIMDAHQEQSED